MTTTTKTKKIDYDEFVKMAEENKFKVEEVSYSHLITDMNYARNAHPSTKKKADRFNTGKWCPAVILYNKEWYEFKKRVQAELNRIKSGKKKPAKPKKAKKKNTSSKWKTNRHGTQWRTVRGVWINGSKPIKKRKGSPKLSAPSSGWMKPGQRLDYREQARADGHIWLLDLKSDQWVPVKTWNARSGKVGRDWGTWK
ncbi:SH3 domain-containing protein [Salinicoccus sp. CNSTN-B1]